MTRACIGWENNYGSGADNRQLCSLVLLGPGLARSRHDRRAEKISDLPLGVLVHPGALCLVPAVRQILVGKYGMAHVSDKEPDDAALSFRLRRLWAGLLLAGVVVGLLSLLPVVRRISDQS